MKKFCTLVFTLSLLFIVFVFIPGCNSGEKKNEQTIISPVNILPEDNSFIHSEEWINKGLTLYEEGKYNDARECFDDALRAGDESGKIYYEEGLDFYEKDEIEEAKRCYHKAIFYYGIDNKFKWYGGSPSSRLSEDALRCIEEGNIASLRDLLEKDPETVFSYIEFDPFKTGQMKTFRYCTLLHAATFRGDVEIVELLIFTGAYVNSQDIYSGATPLYYAVEEGFIDLVALLIERGADVNYSNGTSIGTPLHRAVSEDNIEIVEMLIENGADVNGKDSDGETPLHNVKSKEIGELLLLKGADVKAKSSDGKTPLHWARNKEIGILFINNGAEVNCVAEDEKTPLHSAVIKDFIDLAEMLIEKGADVNAIDDWKSTPLHKAENNNMARLLLDNGAILEAKDLRGSTPLYNAVMFDNMDLADFLMEKGADVNFRNPDGESLLDRARSEEMKELLIRYGAKPEI